MEKLIRNCTVEDIGLLRELSVKTFYEAFAPLNTEENMAAYLETAFNADRLSRELADENSEFYFLYYGERLAGYLKLNEAPSQTDINDEKSLEIERIYVSSEFQGAGLGSFLMQQALAKAIERGKKYVWLGVWEKNERALRFYRRNGFYKIGTHTFAVGEDAQTDHIMKKELP